MIRFVCRECGKPHERPAEAAGTLVFCECGHPVRLPWPSLVAEAAPPAAAVLQPIPVLEPAETEHPRVLTVTRADGPRRDPGRCFNHPDVASETRCADCGEPFCAACVVSLQGRTLCGPCKNLYLRGLQRPPRVSGLAVGALLLSLASGPVLFVLMMLLAALKGPLLPGLFGLLPALAAVLLGAVALREIEANPRVGGRALAITALVVAVAASVLFTTLAVAAQRGME